MKYDCRLQDPMLSPDRPPAHMDQAGVQNPARDGLTPTQSLPPPQDGQVHTMHANKRCTRFGLHDSHSSSQQTLLGQVLKSGVSGSPESVVSSPGPCGAARLLLRPPSVWAAAGPPQRAGQRAESIRAGRLSEGRGGAHPQLSQQDVSPHAWQDASSAVARAGHTISANHPTDQPSPP